MAFTNFEKQMIDIIDQRCRRGSTDAAKRTVYQGYEATLLKGDEAEVQALIATFIADEGMVQETTNQITVLNTKVTELNTLKTDMAAYIA